MPSSLFISAAFGVLVTGVLLLLGSVLSLSSFFLPETAVPPKYVDNEYIDPNSVLLEKTNDVTFSTTSILFLGDVLLARNVEFLMDIHGPAHLWSDISQYTNTHQYVVANFESAMAVPHFRTRAYTTQFTTAAGYLEVLSEAGITHVSLANNHTYDFGVAGYINARQQLTRNEIIPFGNPESLSKEESVAFISINNLTVALIAIHAVFKEPSLQEITDTVNAATKNSDMQIAYIHWGEEYVLTHNVFQSSLATDLIAAGIDTIIGHHPHVTQDIQVISGVPVFYSLGNFIFDQYFSADVQQGYMLALTPSPSRLDFEIIPVTSIKTRSKPELMVGVEKEVFLQKLAGRSVAHQNDNILLGKAIFDFSLASSSQTSIISP